ncbi:hypothetical protein SAMN02745118_01331 [Selenihalanaerobacter shriftii]|uniref:SpoVT-AbrB domain-containing protein n=1 Tax=Selenihalanaerobacter shriftii TaxID=142842 RepID=A0A1T4M0R2_9FIRM|nr:hypothetical protein SAMN02745118_01331 [Selenihalanaerobacter shriftii]
MKATGIVRKVDNLGRIVLPAELRKNLDIESKDSGLSTLFRTLFSRTLTFYILQG